MQEDVQEVYAPGRLFFIKRTDPQKPNNTHATTNMHCTGDHISDNTCKTVQQPKVQPKEADNEVAADKLRRAASTPQPYPGATFQIIEGAASERFKRIVLRETCLMDHLCGGYVQGLEYVLAKLQGDNKQKS